MTAIDSRAGDAATPVGVRTLIRKIVDGVAAGQKYHLRVVFCDNTTHDTTRLGDPDVTTSHHYHRTVEQWLKNLEAHWERIREIDPQRLSEKFRRTWLFYLGGAAETFEAAREIINCYHVTFVKGHFTGADLH
ncbi:class I SAM-dependent methyltransferase [Ideonella sp. YS5]|uniref:class I SAM-dependent methyltransferase n=1 Tax=Ideonella sp. YS5 TaxID=3453714 RepID=UPI003EEA2C5D